MALALLCAGRVSAAAQPASHDEASVGSERALYQRMLQVGAPGFSPWAPATRPPASFRVLRPTAMIGVNSTFPWQADVAGPVWLGRGVTGATTAGIAANWWRLSAKIEPVFWYATNAGFELQNPAAGFRDPVRAFDIDKPQRFGDSPYGRVDAGESFVRLDVAGLTLGFSNERLFWGPGVRHALLFSSTSPGFPHLFVGTTDSIETPLGALHGRIIYGRLEQSPWSPPAASKSRFGTGVMGWWRPRGIPLALGGARFYHRAWPGGFTASDLTLPFGSLFFDEQLREGGPEDNQLASVFFSLPFRRARFEMFGEFGRNDRSVDTRDFIVEPEHNSAWLLGFVRVFNVDSSRATFWSARLEVANGRIAAIQDILRGQSTFFTHVPLNQGHTHRGMLLGTPLIDLSGGSELSVDRWNADGRVGVSLLQRQMPPDALVGMPAPRARTQWDLGFSLFRFIGTAELGVRLGEVFDINRFPETDVFNTYLVLSWRQAVN